jgi:hypothetical protein
VDSDKFWRIPFWKMWTLINFEKFLIKNCGLWQILPDFLLKIVDSDKFYEIPYQKSWTLTNFEKFLIKNCGLWQNLRNSLLDCGLWQILTNFLLNLDLEIFMSDSGLRNFLISDSGLRTFFEIDFKLLCKKYYTTMPYYAIQWMIMNLIAISRILEKVDWQILTNFLLNLDLEFLDVGLLTLKFFDTWLWTLKFFLKLTLNFYVSNTILQ